MAHPLTRTYLALIGVMALWGGTWVAGRVLAQSIPALPAAFLRYVLASLLLVLVCVRAEGRLPRLRRHQVLPVAGLGLSGVFAYSVFFFFGLQRVSASRAALIVACIPACIALVSALGRRERLGGLRLLGVAVSLVGVAVVIADGAPLTLLSGGVGQGDLLILGCVASWTAYSLGGHAVMRTLPPLAAVAWSSLIGTLLLLPAALLHGLTEAVVRARPVDWLCLAYLGGPATALAYFWYYRAIGVLGPSRSGVFINAVPVFAVLFGFLLLGEPIGPSLIGGGLLVMAGVSLTNRP